MTTRGHHGILLGQGAANFPIYLSNTATDLGGADATTHLVNMPATVIVSDLLISLIAVDGNPTITTPSGWTLLSQNNSSTAQKGAVYYKVADGSEGGTTVDFVTSAAERMMAQVVRVQAGTYSGSPEAASVQTTLTMTSLDPPSLTTSWGAESTLWIAMVAIDGTRTVSGYPLPNNQVRTASASTGTAYVTLASCSDNVNSASLDPSAFTITVGSTFAGFTIGIRPA